jgi:hypothetical protein
MRLDSFALHALLIALVLISCTTASASSVQQVTIEQMLKNSELVFEATVTGVNAHFENPGNHIATDVTFQVIEVIKGNLSKGTVVLSFSGGTIGEMTEVIGDMHIPKYREHGVYFVESLQRKQVHPFYGWDQGHFTVQTTKSGADLVTTRSGHPVQGLQSGKQTAVGALSNGVALGIQVSEANANSGSLTLGEFKSQLRRIAQGLQ